MASIELNDPRYRELKNTKVPLKLVGNDFDQRFLTLLQDRDAAQSEREAAAQLVKEVEARCSRSGKRPRSWRKRSKPAPGPKTRRPGELEQRPCSAEQCGRGELERDRTAANGRGQLADAPNETSAWLSGRSTPTCRTSTRSCRPITRTSRAATGRSPRSPAIRRSPASIPRSPSVIRRRTASSSSKNATR